MRAVDELLECGSAQREAFLSVAAAGIEGEARDPDLVMTFERLGAGDLTGRAQALWSLTEAGVDLTEARRLTGLE